MCELKFNEEREEMKKPVVFYSGNTVVRAGNIVCVRGEYFELNWTASITDGVNAEPVELQQLNRQSFKFQIPKNFQDGVYTLQLCGEECLTLTLNAPKVRWMQGNQGETGTADGWIRMQGECLRVTNDAKLYAEFTSCDGAVTRMEPQRVYDDYSVGFSLEGMAEGEYRVAYYNGFASCDCGAFTVASSVESSWGKEVYNVQEYGVPKDVVTDCTEALISLLERVKREGGGIVYFPRGRYRLTGGFHIPQGVILRGDGYERSQIFWTDEWHEMRVLEDGKEHWMPTPLPEVMITADGNFAIEGLEFAAARIGRLFQLGTSEKPVKNVRIENVRVNANAFAGGHLHARHGQYNYIGRCEVLKETMMDKSDMFSIFGSNITIKDCKFLWSGRMFNFGGNMDHLLIQNVIFGGATAVDDWMPIGTLDHAILEDSEIHEWTCGCGGNNIYMARMKIQDVVDNNREAFTTDITAGIDYHGPAKMDGLSFTFPEEIEMEKAKPGSVLCILSGTGAGQFRTVKEVQGQTVTIDEPFLVTPDEQSHLTVNYMFRNWYFTDITLDNGGSLQFYTAQGNTVVDGMKITRSGGVKGFGQRVYSSVANNWYNSYINNTFSDGNYYHMGGWYIDQNLPGSSFLCTNARNITDEPINLCCTIRGNDMRDNTLIYIDDAVGGGICDAVVESNHSADCRCGIYIGGSPERLLLSENSFERVDQEICYKA